MVIKRNLREKLSPEDYAIAMKQHTNLCTDLSKIVEQDPIKYEKVSDDVI